MRSCRKTCAPHILQGRMNLDSRIYVSGHRGLVGSAIWRELTARGFKNLIGRTRTELDLLDGPAVSAFYEKEKPETRTSAGMISVRKTTIAPL